MSKPESLHREEPSDDEQPEDGLADEHWPLGYFLVSEMNTETRHVPNRIEQPQAATESTFRFRDDIVSRSLAARQMQPRPRDHVAL